MMIPYLWMVYPNSERRFEKSFIVVCANPVFIIEDIFMSSQKAQRVANALNRLERRYSNVS